MFAFLHFLKAALKNPLGVSTVFATGAGVAKRLADFIPANSLGLVIELGVGTGAITEVILARLEDPTRYLGFELDAEMIEFVRQRFPQARFVQASAEDFMKYLDGRKVSAVISTLPWTLMPATTVSTILTGIRTHLSPEGGFATYITLHVLKTPAGRRVQALFSETFPSLQTENVAINLPPARVFLGRLS